LSVVYYDPENNTYEDGQVVLWPSGTTELADQKYGVCYEARLNAQGDFYWDEQIIPEEMKGWLIEAVFADALANDKQYERAKEHLDMVAYPELYRAAKANTVQQGAANAARIKARMPR
jgi:hypothetical protein